MDRIRKVVSELLCSDVADKAEFVKWMSKQRKEEARLRRAAARADKAAGGGAGALDESGSVTTTGTDGSGSGSGGIANTSLLYVLSLMQANDQIPESVSEERIEEVRLLLVGHAQRGLSGVMVIAVFTSPYPKIGAATHTFSCEYDCHYCPAEPGQPRSYLLREPGVLRANRSGFDCVRQFYDRAQSYATLGHPVDKVELLVLGGTWSSYPEAYRDEFVRDIYYAANTFFDEERGTAQARPRRSIREEQVINETAACKIIGLTIETRPDKIRTADDVRKLREYGVTRVQLGVQHFDDRILRKINRGCLTADAIRSFKLLKDCCFKIDMHLMPDLPGSDVEQDRAMLARALTDPDVQADQWKVYPTAVTGWTTIKKWHDEGSYRPYGDTRNADGSSPLIELLLWLKARVPPWIRLNRVVRDIPQEYVEGGNPVANLRQELQRLMAERRMACACIRCREVRARACDESKVELVARRYEASGGTEVFLSFEAPVVRDALRGPETKKQRRRRQRSEWLAEQLAKHRAGEKTYVSRDELETAAQAERDAAEAAANPPPPEPELTALLGFLRLRLTPDAGADGCFPELEGCALIRELHVYGQVVAVGKGSESATSTAQHRGYGSRLLEEAERLARLAGHRRAAVIAGNGTKVYYRKRGYLDEGAFLIKDLGPLRDDDRRDDDVVDEQVKDDEATTPAGAGDETVATPPSSRPQQAKEARSLGRTVAVAGAAVVGAVLAYQLLRRLRAQ